MGIFLRQIVALAALWALCELLLPEGTLARMVRLVVSLLVMAVLLTSLVDALSGAAKGGLPSAKEAFGNVVFESAGVSQESAQDSYIRAVLRSQANQAEDICARMARKAGYEAVVAVYLRESGALERMDVQLKRDNQPEAQVPLLSPRELRQSIAEAFAVDISCIKLMTDEGEAE